MTVQNNIRKIRKDLPGSKTQRDIAKNIPISLRVISTWETRKTLPSLENALKLAKALNCKVDDIFYLEN